MLGVASLCVEGRLASGCWGSHHCVLLLVGAGGHITVCGSAGAAHREAH